MQSNKNRKEHNRGRTREGRNRIREQRWATSSEKRRRYAQDDNEEEEHKDDGKYGCICINNVPDIFLYFALILRSQDLWKSDIFCLLDSQSSLVKAIEEEAFIFAKVESSFS